MEARVEGQVDLRREVAALWRAQAVAVTVALRFKLSFTDTNRLPGGLEL